MESHNRRIARNTIFLYLRMFFTMAVSLYTSRVVLQTLGVNNYGIYNIVGGVVAIFSFLNGSMTGATQRFLNFEMGRGDAVKLRDVFSSAMYAHLGIGAALILLGETVGLWFVNTQLVIAPERMAAANWTYQLSLLTAVATLLQVPYNAAIIAHERMDVFAYLSIMQSLLKLGVAFLLLFVAEADTLIIYAWLMFGVSFLIFAGYRMYCLRHFAECHVRRGIPRDTLKAMLSFSGADIFGQMSFVARVQCLLIILNRLGGTVLNAAGSITMTVTGAISQFGYSIINAFRPQIVQQYSMDNIKYMCTLITNASKFATLLLSLVAVPVIINMDVVLHTWLTEVPRYTTVFCQIAISAEWFLLIVFALNCGVHATGKMVAFSVISGSIYLAEIPGMYYAIRLTSLPQAAYVLHLGVMLCQIAVSSLILKRHVPQFPLWRFVRGGVFLPLAITLAGGCISWFAVSGIGNAWISVGISCCVNAIVILTLTWLVAIDRDTKADIKQKIRSKLSHSI